MKTIISTCAVLVLLVCSTIMADELTMMVEQDLARLGYEPGPVDGEETMETVVAITKFQAANQLEITGEVTSDLARALMAAEPAGGATAATAAAPAAATAAAPAAATAAAPAAAPAADPAALQAAQQACLQEKMMAAQEAQKKKRGFGRLLSAVTREAYRAGDYDLARTAGDIYSANATADDLSAAAKDLGLTEDEVAACQNP
jgi:peptidoglycan hydrolase-like protein with peptidoglycan-binding domain